MRFTTTMRTARARAGLSQASLASELDQLSGGDGSWTRVIVTAIEGGKREPRLSEAQLIARTLGFSLDALTEDDDEVVELSHDAAAPLDLDAWRRGLAFDPDQPPADDTAELRAELDSVHAALRAIQQHLGIDGQ